MGTENSSATLRACILQPAILGVQLQKTLVKWTAVTSMPWSIINFTASVLSRPPERRATAFLVRLIIVFSSRYYYCLDRRPSDHMKSGLGNHVHIFLISLAGCRQVPFGKYRVCRIKRQHLH